MSDVFFITIWYETSCKDQIASVKWLEADISSISPWSEWLMTLHACYKFVQFLWQGKMKFVMHNVSEKSRKQARIEKERKPEPPTGLLISFDWLFFSTYIQKHK